ncbi:MAG: 5-formyltetrahydrofolate cyclo-ligase [Oscillospiraceae bacterium]|nr:5-formyltetrahydrofolate cyclo-ligase [Oscillospiraceae bacterium]
MDKAALRRDMRARTAALSGEYIEKSDAGIFENVVALPEYAAAGAVFVYYSLDREPDTHRLVRRALDDGKTVAMPRVLGGGRLEHLRVNSTDELLPSRYGLLEPIELAERVEPTEGDIVIVPAAAYAKDGSRLGRGGGYYDRFLAACPAFTAGLARERLLLDTLPTEPHDMRVACIVTESGVIRL